MTRWMAEAGTAAAAGLCAVQCKGWRCDRKMSAVGTAGNAGGVNEKAGTVQLRVQMLS